MQKKRSFYSAIFIIVALTAVVWSSIRSRNALKELPRLESLERRAAAETESTSAPVVVSRRQNIPGEHMVTSAKTTLEHYQNRQKAKGDPFDWKFSVSVPGGGLLESTNEFDFIAPEGPYAREYELIVPASLKERWPPQIQKSFFLHFKNGIYGRISLRLIARSGILNFESFVNPSGSRNLEYDPAVQETVSNRTD